MLLTPLAWPLMAIAIAAGLGVLTIGWLVPPLAPLLGAVCGWSLHVTEQLVVARPARARRLSATARAPAWWLCVLLRRRRACWPPCPRCGRAWRWQARLAMLCGWPSATLQPRRGRAAAGELRCTFLARGPRHVRGARTARRANRSSTTPAASARPSAPRRSISSYLWSRGIDRIDAIVLSHADIDHYNAHAGTARAVPRRRRLHLADDVRPRRHRRRTRRRRITCATCSPRAGVPLREIWMDDRLRTADAGVAIEVLHPPREGVIGRDNANSLLLAVEFAGQPHPAPRRSGVARHRAGDGRPAAGLRHPARPAPRQRAKRPARLRRVVHARVGRDERRATRSNTTLRIIRISRQAPSCYTRRSTARSAFYRLSGTTMPNGYVCGRFDDAR